LRVETRPDGRATLDRGLFGHQGHYPVVRAIEAPPATVSPFLVLFA